MRFVKGVFVVLVGCVVLWGCGSSHEKELTKLKNAVKTLESQVSESKESIQKLDKVKAALQELAAATKVAVAEIEAAKATAEPVKSIKFVPPPTSHLMWPDWNSQPSAVVWSTLSIVLAGFVFSAIVMLLRNAKELESTDAFHVALSSLFVAFLLLIISANLFSICTGELIDIRGVIISHIPNFVLSAALPLMFFSLNWLCVVHGVGGSSLWTVRWAFMLMVILTWTIQLPEAGDTLDMIENYRAGVPSEIADSPYAWYGKLLFWASAGPYVVIPSVAFLWKNTSFHDVLSRNKAAVAAWLLMAVWSLVIFYCTSDTWMPKNQELLVCCITWRLWLSLAPIIVIPFVAYLWKIAPSLKAKWSWTVLVAAIVAVSGAVWVLVMLYGVNYTKNPNYPVNLHELTCFFPDYSAIWAIMTFLGLFFAACIFNLPTSEQKNNN